MKKMNFPLLKSKGKFRKYCCTFDTLLTTTLCNLNRQFYDEKIITMLFTSYKIKRLTDLNSLGDPNGLVYHGLSLIYYSPHPTIFDLITIIKFIKPKRVTAIHENGKMPKVLTSLCRKEKKVNNFDKS